MIEDSIAEQPASETLSVPWFFLKSEVSIEA